MNKKVLVKGPGLSLSGYGEQIRFALRSLKEREDLDLYFLDIPWGKTGQFYSDREEREWLNFLIQKTRDHVRATNNNPGFDVSVQVTIPNEFEKIATFNVGYTAGIETTKISAQWVSKCNEMDLIVVPSFHSKGVMEKTSYTGRYEKTGEEVQVRVKTPVEVCAFPALQKTPKHLELNLSTDWNFLAVAQWGPRKNLQVTIVNFIKEFKDDNVGLILKVNTSKNSTMDKIITEQRLQTVLNSVKERGQDYKCKVHLLHGNLTDEEMRGLYRHPKVKAVVSTSHGEGFGLPLFEAAIEELPVIAPAWSAHVDFLYAPKKIKGNKIKNKPHFTKIDYALEYVQKEVVWKDVIVADSQWAYAKDHSIRDSMREVFKNYGPKLSDAKKLSKVILENFNQEKQFEFFISLVAKKYEQESELDVLFL
jgi:hypothetical protein